MGRKGAMPTYIVVVIFLIIGLIVYIAFFSIQGSAATLVDSVSCKMEVAKCLIGHNPGSCTESVICIVK